MRHCTVKPRAVRIQKEEWFTPAYFYCFLLLSPLWSNAQIPDLRKGDRVRVWGPKFNTGKIIGTVEFARTQPMVLYSKDSTLTVNYSSIERLEIAVGEKRQSLKGFLFGMGGGPCSAPS